MVKRIKDSLAKLSVKRTTVLVMFFAFLFFLLVHRLFELQIIQGNEYAENFSVRITKQRTLKSTRGNIYDRNGNLLAYNELSYSVTLEDNGSYNTTREKQLTLNGVAYKVLQILNENGDEPDKNFHIIIDENGNYAFDISGTSLDRFKADIFGEPKIEDMEEWQATATAEEIIDHLSSSESGCYAIVNKDRPYSEEELAQYGLPSSLSKEDILSIVRIRYALSTNSFQKYLAVTIATDVSDETVASIMENKDTLQGIDIAEDTKRVYTEGIYFSSIIGYTGKASTEELESLKEQSNKYNNNSVVGKAGIEQYMEIYLQGTDGSENVYVDNLGKVLQIDEDSIIQPQAGNDVYLTIDKDLQIAAYKLLEQKIAGIVVSNIVQAKDFDKTVIQDAKEIRIPIYDVYFSMINNNVIDINHFRDENASATERDLYARFLEKQEKVFEAIREELTGSSPVTYENLSTEMQEYLKYIVSDYLMTKTGILSSDAIDASDATYQSWSKEGTISLQEFLTYAVSQNWIDISKIELEGEYLDSKEVYNALADYLSEYLANDKSFSKLLYKYMLHDDMISGTQICIILYDQGVLSTDDGDYEGLISGQTSAYDFMIRKLSNLEITPAQLALDPCSGSLVATDPNTGEILACVSYPGYDNNRLANQMDTSYWNQLVADQAEPLYNKATQQRTAPGSTFKIVTAVAGIMENMSITQPEDGVVCSGVFDLVNPPINCWHRAGHGWLDLEHAIKDSCNVYFSQVAYNMGLNANEVFSESTALQKLSVYAQSFDLDKNSGIEITEATPQISDDSAVRSAFGQGTHAYTTSQLARYCSTIANSGTSYNISLLDKVTDSEGNVLEDYTPTVESTLDISQENWNRIHSGMRMVVENNAAFMDFSFPVAGKTGTAQQVKTRPDHGLFIGFAPYESPEIAVAVRIAFGYSSGNAASVARDFFSYSFEVEDEETLLTGMAKLEEISLEQTD